MDGHHARSMLCAAILLSALLPTGKAAAAATVAVADFDYNDTSGEVADQTAAHRARVESFGKLLRDNLAHRDFRVVRPDCAEPSCTAAGMAADDLIAAARQGGARYLIYGGIRKMSTLVQWGEVQLLDLEREQLLFRRTVTFRGDTDEAFRRAADFVGDTVNDAIPK